MKTETYIDLLLKKYRQMPSFPFDDWTENSVSFYALMNLWDELIKTAGGKSLSEYSAAGEVKMDINSNIYDVIHRDRTRRISTYPEKEGGTFYVISKYGDEEFSLEKSDVRYWPDRSQLGFATNLERSRLIACFEIVRHYTHAEITSPDDADALHQVYVERYKQIFGFPDFDPFAPPNHDEDEDA